MGKTQLQSYYILVASLFLLVIADWHVIQLLYSKWMESGTYAHGIVIFPISGYIIYSKRKGLSQIPLEPYGPALIILICLTFSQFVFNIASVVILEQFTLIAMIHALVLGILGKACYRFLLFPLMYLFFAIPFGHFMVETLQDITANFTAFALKLSGLTIFHDKWIISTTRGDFEVAAACSGVRYLIASIALGTLFAYYAYQSTKKRIYFITLAIVLPIIANAIRAYLIIMIAYLSHMKLAVGVDHLIYGWLFFGLLIIILFSVGSKYADPMPRDVLCCDAASSAGSGVKRSTAQLLMLVPLIVLVFQQSSMLQLNMPFVSNYDIKWQTQSWGPVQNETYQWRPRYQGTLSSQLQRFSGPEGDYVDVYVGLYGLPAQDQEAVSSQNLPFDKSQWNLSKQGNQQVVIHQERFSVEETELHNIVEHQLVWQWYEVLGVKTHHPLIAKGLEVLKILSQNSEPTRAILIAAPYQHHPDEARSKILAFMKDANLFIQEKDST
ncbi:MAG: exosortase A [Gammaproteobacteria bacterium]